PRRCSGAGVAFVGQLDDIDHFVHRTPTAVVAAVHLDQLGDRQVVLDAALLQDDPDPLAQLAGAIGRIHAQHPYLPGAPRTVSLEDLDDRGLTRAVRAKEAEHLA